MTITIDTAYLADCSIAYPGDCLRVSRPMPANAVVWLRHRTGTTSIHPLMADRRTIGAIGHVLDCGKGNHDMGFGRFPDQEDLIRV
jgi:hypothetical protein